MWCVCLNLQVTNTMGGAINTNAWFEHKFFEGYLHNVTFVKTAQKAPEMTIRVFARPPGKLVSLEWRKLKVGLTEGDFCPYRKKIQLKIAFLQRICAWLF